MRAPRSTTNLGETIESVLAFQRDLEARKLDDRVIIELWSEFGRRPRENGSGTDHGAAGVAFLIGSRVKGTMVGEFPGLVETRPERKPRQHHRLPGDVRRAARPVVPNRSGPRDPGAGTGLEGPSAYGPVPQLIA